MSEGCELNSEQITTVPENICRKIPEIPVRKRDYACGINVCEILLRYC